MSNTTNNAEHTENPPSTKPGSKDFAIVGLGVMGQGLAENMARNGFDVVGYDVSAKQRSQFSSTFAGNALLSTASSLEALVSTLSLPRRILLLVPAGTAIDQTLERLMPLLVPGDIVIDGGNSHFLDTERRQTALKDSGIHFVGMGVSGGEEGARNGPSLMPGGDRSAFDAVAPILRHIAAKAPQDGQPCVDYMGPGGAGHFTKMVHNGIEYAEMQLIAEIYHLLTTLYGQSAQAIGTIFEDWNSGEEGSFLLGVSASVLQAVDPESAAPVVDIILDQAGQKGTGRWTSQTAFDLGVGVPSLTAALDARILSSMKATRLAMAKTFPRSPVQQRPLDGASLQALKDTLFAGRIISFAQGLDMFRAASIDHDYALDLAQIARIWRGGCILASPLLDRIALAYQEENGSDAHLFSKAWFQSELERMMPNVTDVAMLGLQHNLPLPTISSSKTYFDLLRMERCPANLIQAQRDYFGAHGFERIDKPGSHHFDWRKQ